MAQPSNVSDGQIISSPSLMQELVEDFSNIGALHHFRNTTPTLSLNGSRLWVVQTTPQGYSPLKHNFSALKGGTRPWDKLHFGPPMEKTPHRANGSGFALIT